MNNIKKITVCVWKSQSKSFSPIKLMSRIGGLHASLMLFNVEKDKDKDKDKKPLIYPLDNSFEDKKHDFQIATYVNYVPNTEKQSSCPEIIPTKYKKQNFNENQNVALDQAINDYKIYKGKRKERKPELTLEIPVKNKNSEHGLDYDKIQQWWELVNRNEKLNYSYFSNNCSFGVLQALKAGGADEYLEYDNWFLTTPNKVGQYSQDLAKAI